MTLPTQDTQTSRPKWLPESEYPFQLRSLTIGANTITYVDEGSGPTLLFVHTGMWSFIFRDVITRLSKDFRCITLDFPGYGLSPEPANGDMGLEDQAGFLSDFVITLGLSDIALVVHDLGGNVGVGFAATHPELVDGFVMANTFAWKPRGKALRRMLRIISSRPLTTLDWMTRFIPRITATRFGVGRRLSRAGKRAFRGPFGRRRRIRRFHALMRDALRADDFFARIERATQEQLGDKPILTIFGENNDPFGFQERHHNTFRNHEALIVAKGNHFPMMDDPDLFADTVREWWSRRIRTGHNPQ